MQPMAPTSVALPYNFPLLTPSLAAKCLCPAPCGPGPCRQVASDAGNWYSGPRLVGGARSRVGRLGGRGGPPRSVKTAGRRWRRQLKTGEGPLAVPSCEPSGVFAARRIAGLIGIGALVIMVVWTAILAKEARRA